MSNIDAGETVQDVESCIPRPNREQSCKLCDTVTSLSNRNSHSMSRCTVAA